MFAVEVYAAVRHFVLVEGNSRREAARVFGLSRETVLKMCRFSLPPGYTRTKPVAKPKLGALMALLVLAFAGQNVTVASGARDISHYGATHLGEHAARLFNQDGKLEFDMDTLRIAVRSLLIDVLSCWENRSDSSVVSRVATQTISCPIWARTSSCPACRGLRSKRPARTRPTCRARR